MPGRADAIYAHLPIWGQHVAVSTYGLWWKRLRFGGRFDHHCRIFRERDRWTAGDWSTWQSDRLRAVLQRAAEAVPHYRENWDDQAKQAARDGVLEAIPLLEKDPVRTDPHCLVDRAARRGRALTFYTSGSTGTPIASLWTRDELRASMAVREVRSAGWAGVSFTQPRATFSGRISVPDPNSAGPYHRVNLAERQIYFSPFHLGPKTASQYVDALRRHRTEWLTGYAVSFHLLAQFMLEQRIDPPDDLRAVITTSEKLAPRMRDTMRRAYGCSVFEEYSTVENVLFASECEHGSLHVSPDIGVVEILDQQGRPCPPGVVGEIVATQTFRQLQPFVRFRLGDLASWSDEPCACGRAMPVLAGVDGRVEDVVIGLDGRRLVRFHGIFIDLDGVREGQVVQEQQDGIRLRLVPEAGLDEPGAADRRAAVEQVVRARFEQRLGAGMQIDVDWVDAIERTKAGKFRAVISKLDVDDARPPQAAAEERPNESNS